MAAGDLENQKPKCGGGNNVTDDYDVTLHTLGLFVVLAASCLGAGFPVVAKKVSWVRVPEKVFFACKHFGTGVLIATAFVHLVPTAFDSLGDPCLPDLFTDLYTPMPGVIMMGSLFVLFVIEMWLNSKTGGHSHGGPTGCPTAPAAHQFDSRSTLHLPENQTNDGAGNRNSQFVERLDEKEAESDSEDQGTVTVYEVSSDTESQPEVDPAVYRKMAANIALLEGGILFHSVFVGMTVSITVDGYIILLIAIIFHQMFEGLGLGSRIAAVPYPKGSLRPWFLVFAFGTTAPIGQAIGLAARNTYDPNSAFGLIIVGVFNAISSGLLIYAALVDLLAEDFLSEEARRVMTTKKKVCAFCWVLAGAIGMSIVGAFA